MNPLKYVNKQRHAYTSAKAKEIAKLAQKVGITSGSVNGEGDAFRHIYAAADSTRQYGSTITLIGGKANEWIKEGLEGNPTDEWQMDEHNNQLGAILGQQAKAENWDNTKLVDEVAKAVKDGRAKLLAPRQNTNNTATGYPGYDEDGRMKFPLDSSLRREAVRKMKLFGSWREVEKPEMSPPASVLDSIKAYFKKK